MSRNLEQKFNALNIKNIYHLMDELYMILNLQSFSTGIDLLLHSTISYTLILEIDNFNRLYENTTIFSHKNIFKFKRFFEKSISYLTKYMDELKKEKLKNKFVIDFINKLSYIYNSLKKYDIVIKVNNKKVDFNLSPIREDDDKNEFKAPSYGDEPDAEDITFFIYFHKRDPSKKRYITKISDVKFDIEDEP